MREQFHSFCTVNDSRTSFRAVNGVLRNHGKCQNTIIAQMKGVPQRGRYDVSQHGARFTLSFQGRSHHMKLAQNASERVFCFLHLSDLNPKSPRQFTDTSLIKSAVQYNLIQRFIPAQHIFCNPKIRTLLP